MIISIIAILAGIAMIAVSLVFYQVGGGHQGGGDSYIWFGLENIILGIAGAFLVGIGVTLAAIGDSQHIPTTGPERIQEDVVRDASHDGIEVRSDSAGEVSNGMEVEGLVLRLLDGDERRMFLALRDAGGESLQKDLIEKTKMSNAKVTRVLDRLEDKGLIVKERHGMTNKVRINIERD
jgi:predicted transcriptional regulator